MRQFAIAILKREQVEKGAQFTVDLITSAAESDHEALGKAIDDAMQKKGATIAGYKIVELIDDREQYRGLSVEELREFETHKELVTKVQGLVTTGLQDHPEHRLDYLESIAKALDMDLSLIDYERNS